MAKQSSHSLPSLTEQLQLKEACRLSRVRWAAWLRLLEGHWEFLQPINLNRGKQAILRDFIAGADTITWLAGAFTSGRMRSRQTGSVSAALGCQRVYVFPSLAKGSSQTVPSVLLVGTDDLEKTSENIFRVLAMNSPVKTAPATRRRARSSPDLPEPAKIETRNFPKPSLESLDVYAGVAANPERVLRNVLELLAGFVPCDAAYIAIRSGENFRIEAASGLYEMDSIQAGAGFVHGMSFSMREDHALAEMVATRQGKLFGLDHPDQIELPRFLPHLGDQPGQSGVSLPIVIGQRVIGLVSLVSLKPGAFSLKDIGHITLAAKRLAYVVENALMFAETARYLQQLALLNEMASSASQGVDTQQVAQRVMERLRRTFHTEWAGVYLLSQDRQSLREYGGAALGDMAGFGIALETFAKKQEQGLPLAQVGEQISELSLVEAVVKTGRPYRGGSKWDEQPAPAEHSSQASESRTGRPKFRSLLAVPLKYQGTVIGALALNSLEKDAFSVQDEQLLVVIASHISGLFENMRLNEETRQRAQKLQETVRQLHTVRETALDIGESAAGSPTGSLDLDGLLRRVARRARQLVDAGGAELGLVDFPQTAEEPQTAERPQTANETQTAEAHLNVGEGAEKVKFRVWVSDTPWVPSEQLNPHQRFSKVTAPSSGFPMIADLAARVVTLAEPVVVNDLTTWEGGIYSERELPFRAIAGVPLKVQSGVLSGEQTGAFAVIGVLMVSDDRSGKKFRPEDIQLLELLSPLVTVWIRNARLYQELQERIEAQQVTENRLVRSARLAAVGEMAAGVAHELNNPLTTVVGFVELVLEELSKDSPHYPDLELVLREAQRARGVVRRLLDFSRPAENQRARTDLNELVSDVLTLVHHLVRTGGVEMHIELWNDLPWIAVDPGQIKQVLLNLIHNAIQAMPKGGILTVKTAPVDRGGRDWLSVSIADTGIGIPPENLERIFEPFFTTRHAVQRAVPSHEGKPASAQAPQNLDFQAGMFTDDSGTGLGLSVSYGIISEHHGSIEVESQPGQGSCFTIYLPVDEGEGGEAVDV